MDDKDKIYYNVERFGFIQKLTPVNDIIDLMPDSMTMEDFKDIVDDKTNHYMVDGYGYRRHSGASGSFFIVDVGVIRSQVMTHLNKYSTQRKKFFWLSEMVDLTCFADAFDDSNRSHTHKYRMETLVHNIGRTGSFSKSTIRSRYYRGNRHEFKIALPVTEDDKLILAAKLKKSVEAKRLKNIYKEGLTKDEIIERWQFVMYTTNRCLDGTPIYASGSECSMIKKIGRAHV